MNEQNNYGSKAYLKRFDEILDDMAVQMLSQNVTNNITINFIRCMIPHHQAAISMCNNLLRYSNNSKLRKLAEDIIRTQSQGIRTMIMIEQTTFNYQNDNYQVYQYMNRYYRIVNTMIRDMKNSSQGGIINLDFISEMIPHHEGAIKMCQNVLRFNIDPRLINLVQNIIKEQVVFYRDRTNQVICFLL